MKLFNYAFLSPKLLFVCTVVYSITVQTTCFAEKIRFTIASPISPPFYYLDDEKKPQGLILELFSLVENKTDIKIDVVVMPWARALKEVQKGNVNALLGARYSEERKQYLVFPDTPIMSFKTLLFKRTNDDIDLDDVNNPLLELSIATVRSTQLPEQFYNNMAQGKNKIIEVLDFNTAIKMLNIKRVDLVPGIDFIGQSLIKQMGLEEKIAVMAYLDHLTPVYIAFSKQFAARHNVNDIMLRIRQVLASEDFQKQLKENWQIKDLENVGEY